MMYRRSQFNALTNHSRPLRYTFEGGNLQDFRVFKFLERQRYLARNLDKGVGM
jgi:hypothetical protein